MFLSRLFSCVDDDTTEWLILKVPCLIPFKHFPLHHSSWQHLHYGAMIMITFTPHYILKHFPTTLLSLTSHYSSKWHSREQHSRYRRLSDFSMLGSRKKVLDLMLFGQLFWHWFIIKNFTKNKKWLSCQSQPFGVFTAFFGVFSS